MQKLKQAKIYLLAISNQSLKEICKLYRIKGFSKLNKEELIDLILKSIPKTNFNSFLNEIEEKSLNTTILLVPKYFLKENPTKLEYLYFNEKENILQLKFKGFKWEIDTYIHFLNLNKINDPLEFRFNCTCEYAKDGGFCSHFWLGLIWAYQNFLIETSRWNKTKLPRIFSELKNKIDFKPFYKEITKLEKIEMNSIEEFLKVNLMGKTQFNFEDLEELSINEILTFISQLNLEISEKEQIKSRKKNLLIELIKNQVSIEEFNKKFFNFKKNNRILEAKKLPIDIINIEWGPPLNCHARLKVPNQEEQILDIFIEDNQIKHSNCHWVYHRQNFCSHLIALFLKVSTINFQKTCDFLKKYSNK